MGSGWHKRHTCNDTRIELGIRLDALHAMGAFTDQFHVLARNERRRGVGLNYVENAGNFALMQSYC